MAKLFVLLLAGLSAQDIKVTRAIKDLIPISKPMELGAGVLWSNGASDFKAYHLNRNKLKSTGKCSWKVDFDGKNTSMCIKVTSSGYRFAPETLHTVDIKGCSQNAKCTFTIPKTMEATPKVHVNGFVANEEWRDQLLDMFPAQAKRDPLKLSMRFKFVVNGTTANQFWFRYITYDIRASLETKVDGKQMKAEIGASLPLKLESGAIDAIFGF